MDPLNNLLMAILMLILLLAVNGYVPLPGLINLLFNMLMLILIVLYLMQAMRAIGPLLPTPKFFK